MPRRQPLQDEVEALVQELAADLSALVHSAILEATASLLRERVTSLDAGWTAEEDPGMIERMVTTATRRTPEARIAVLQAQIQSIKTRAERQKVRRDPALRSILAATKALDRALGSSEDKALRQALGEARLTLASCLSVNGVVVPRGHGAPRKRRAAGEAQVSAVELLPYLRQHPGQGAAAIATALGTDAATLRGPMTQLIAAGDVRAEGRARATRYWAEAVPTA